MSSAGASRVAESGERELRASCGREGGDAPLRLLRDISGVLARAGDPRSALARALGMLVPELCQQAVVDIYEPEGARTFVTAFEDPELDQLAHEVGRRWPPPIPSAGACGSPGNAEPICWEVSEELLASVAHDDEHLALLRQFGVKELLVVPLLIGARTLGTFTLGTDGGRRISDSARLLAGLIAERFAAHLELEYFGRERPALPPPSRRAGEVFSARAELEWANARLSAIRNSGLLGMFEWDREGVIVDANDSFLGMIRSSRADVAERRLELAEVLFDRNGSHDATVAPLLVLDRELLTRDGERVPVLFGVTPIPEFQGRGLGFVLDVTEQRRRAELEELLVGIVSHDLRNPLSVVSMGTSMLLSQELTEPQRKLATRIANASQKSARLISDLLDFTMAKRAGIQLSLAPCDLHDVVAQAVNDLETTWPGRAIVHERFGEAEACLDPSRVEQILINLIGNALQHSPPATAVLVESRGAAEAVVFSVTNCGKPIPNDILLQLFAPLRRGAHAGYQRGSIGLGLFIVQHLVSAHGGTIDVSSSQLAGTRFTVRLPRSRTASPAVPSCAE